MALFLHLNMAALRWPASQTRSSYLLPENFAPVSQCNKYLLDTILFYFSMGIKVNFQCYLVVYSEARDLTHVIQSPRSWSIIKTASTLLFEGKVFCWHSVLILYIYFIFIHQLVLAIDHNLWESCISLPEKSEKESCSNYIQKLWNSTRVFVISI